MACCVEFLLFSKKVHTHKPHASMGRWMCTAQCIIAAECARAPTSIPVYMYHARENVPRTCVYGGGGGGGGGGGWG